MRKSVHRILTLTGINELKIKSIKDPEHYALIKFPEHVLGLIVSFS